MQVPPIQSNKPQPSFGILKGHRKTSYGQYMWGTYKGYKIEVFDATEKHGQKLQYVSNNKTLNWVKSKLTYIQDEIKKIIKSNSKIKEF